MLVKLVEDGDKCTWEVEKTIKIPETANFTDYSAMDIMGDRVRHVAACSYSSVCAQWLV